LKIPRDCTGPELIRALRKFDYAIVRQSGSHIRVVTQQGGEHHVTIPNHAPIKVGTLHGILKDIATHHNLSVDQLLQAIDL